ncbi:hypothetical protein ACFVP8_05730 [Viridibacillus arvi]|uniref:hypothetical protein n=1 Tax=Viridibacillus arvi TaxID=263475 RepID=UPI0036C579A7
MHKVSKNIATFILIVTVLMNVWTIFEFMKRKSFGFLKSGYTIYKSTGIKINYPHINLKKKQFIGTVQYENRIYMTVLVDVQSNTYTVKGSVENILPIIKEKAYEQMTDSEYIDHINYKAHFFVQNNISDFNKYHQEFIQSLPS